VSSSIVAAAAALRDALSGFEAELVSGQSCAVVVEELSATEKLCASVRSRAALRASDCGAHRAQGFTDAAEWLARKTGTSFGEARSAMHTAAAVESCPATREAFVAGELSLDQASEIARAAGRRPGCEHELLATARTAALHTLREEARKARREELDPEELHRRRHRAQHVRHWDDDMGMVWIRGAFSPEVGLPLLNRLEAETDRLAREKGPEGRGMTRARLAAEAFVRLTQGHGKPRANRADMVVVCDLNAHRRGHAHPGEACHIVGAGPIPVSLAKELSADAFVKAVLHDGVAIHTVAHFGRHIPAALRTALELGAPPDFGGVTCAQAGCGRRYGLEWDHLDPVAHNGATSFDNLEPKCRGDHARKTAADRAAGLLGARGDGRDPP
jgi:hypothetical protein